MPVLDEVQVGDPVRRRSAASPRRGGWPRRCAPSARAGAAYVGRKLRSNSRVAVDGPDDRVELDHLQPELALAATSERLDDLVEGEDDVDVVGLAAQAGREPGEACGAGAPSRNRSSRRSWESRYPRGQVRTASVNRKRESIRTGGRRRRVVCLGEALVDLVCEQPVASLADAPSFVPRPGGSLANIATVAARFGAEVEMLGGAGDDEWGRWLRDRLGAEGVDVGRFRLAGAGTAHAFVAISEQREPDFAFFGGEVRPGCGRRARPRARDERRAGRARRRLGHDHRARRARGDRPRARAGGRARWVVLCDPNLRPRRWPDGGDDAGGDPRAGRTPRTSSSATGPRRSR